MSADDDAPIQVSSDMGDLRSATIVLGASNSATPLIGAEHLGDLPTVVIDVAVPPDAKEAVRHMGPRVSVLSGGAVDLGERNAHFASHAPMPKGQAYACMAEVAVLGLDRVDHDF